jgi:UDP-N-acetylmuramate--alanine ligase
MKPLSRIGKSTGGLQGLHNIHFLGVGGAGMSPLAEYLHYQGFKITGYDATSSEATEYLKEIGIVVETVDEHTSLLESDLVVYSSAVSKEHIKRKIATEQGIPQMRRADFLGQVMQKKWTLTISGTHGKTTTTFMLGSIWKMAKQNPIVLGGGYTQNKAEWHVGPKAQGDILIAEADEYDRSFLKMYPTWALINNLEEEHMDCYKDLEELCGVFLEFMHRTPPFGVVALNGDDVNLQKMLPHLKRQHVTFGLKNKTTYQAINIQMDKRGSIFEISYKDNVLAKIKLPILGIHNVYNALGAFSISHSAGIDVNSIVQGLECFEGVQRRLDFLGKEKGISIYDDYAHHPSEISATIDSLKPLGRLIVVFQPHLYSRTKMFYKEFAESLMNADCVFMAPIYKAREKEIAGVSEQNVLQHLESLVQKRKESLKNVPSSYALSFDEKGTAFLRSKLRTGDVVVTMGAGDIWRMGRTLLDTLKGKEVVL